MSHTSIKIGENRFEVKAPYVAGHVVSEIEAKVLNRTFAENVGNNVRAKLKEGAEKGASFEELNAIVQGYADTYEFSEREAGAPRERLDPVEKEALAIAIELVKNAITKKGLNPKDYKAEDIKEKAKAHLATEKGEKIRAQAKKIVAQRQKSSEDADDIEL